jgi:hypothetical protein
VFGAARHAGERVVTTAVGQTPEMERLQREAPDKIAGERDPNPSRKPQGDELEQAQRHAAQHYEALTRQPGLLYRRHMLALRTLRAALFLGLRE